MINLSASELARIERFLLAHKNRFALALVRIPQFPLRSELIQWAEDFGQQHERPFRRFDFTGLKPIEIWRRIEEGSPAGAISIVDGLDSPLSNPESELASLLNRQRERIAELLPGPVLLLLSDTAFTQFLINAPDLADWYSASFEFERDVAPVTVAAEEHPIPALSSELIESRIQLLEKQLHGRLPDRTRARVLMELARLHRDSVFGVPEDPSRPRTRNVVSSLHAAEAALREAVELLRHRAQDHPTSESQKDLSTALDSLAGLYMDQGRYGEAEPLYEEAKRIVERVLGPDHPSTLRSVNNLAYLYESQGRYTEAEPLYHHALAARERVLGPDHPDTLRLVNNLASLYESQGRYAEAEPLYQRALAARERVLGPDHPDTLLSVNNLASLYSSQGRYAEAEPLYQRALAARERLLGPEHPDTLLSVGNLASLYSKQGCYAEAEPLFQRALAARERLLGPDHPDTLRSVNNLAYLYQSQGRYAEAEPLYQRALAARERVLGPDHPDTLLSVNNLAYLYESQGRYTEAERLYERALEGFARILGAEHPDTKLVRNNLDSLRTRMAVPRRHSRRKA